MAYKVNCSSYGKQNQPFKTEDQNIKKKHLYYLLFINHFIIEVLSIINTSSYIIEYY